MRMCYFTFQIENRQKKKLSLEFSRPEFIEFFSLNSPPSNATSLSTNSSVISNGKATNNNNNTNNTNNNNAAQANTDETEDPSSPVIKKNEPKRKVNRIRRIDFNLVRYDSSQSRQNRKSFVCNTKNNLNQYLLSCT